MPATNPEYYQCEWTRSSEDFEMVNQPTKSRRALAAQVAAHYADSPKVAAIVMAGSIARGWADRHSDIELDVYWSEPPEDTDRMAPIHSAGGKIDIFWAEPPSTKNTSASSIGRTATSASSGRMSRMNGRNTTMFETSASASAAFCFRL